MKLIDTALLRAETSALAEEDFVPLPPYEDPGHDLLEVFAVQINNINGEDSGDLYGTITVGDGEFHDLHIYNREIEDAESIKPGESVQLTGPSESIFAYDCVVFKLNLMDRRNSLSPVSRDFFVWNPFACMRTYDQPLFDTVDGENGGSATVIYAAFRRAVKAVVEVTLIKGEEKDGADVYGSVAAGNSKLTDTNYQSVLFRIDKDWEKSVEVSRGMPIPLSRSLVAVPLKSYLKVSTDLYDRDQDLSIAKGSAVFPAKLSGTCEQSIYGDYGEIRVKVTWNYYPPRPIEKVQSEQITECDLWVPW